MRGRLPVSFLLNGAMGWQLTDDLGRSAGHDEIIRLPGDPNGPLSLNSVDGSLGGLVLPAGFALDRDHTVYLVDRASSTLRRFDAQDERFVTIDGIGGRGTEPRQFGTPVAVAITGFDLYVADPSNYRIQVFALPGLALRHVWRGPRDSAWSPVDVVSDGRRAYVLDSEHGAVYVHERGRDRLRRLFAVQEAAGRWTRIAVDRDGFIYLLDPAQPRLQVFSRDGTARGEETDSGQVVERFAPPAIRLDHKERFCLPATLDRPCGRRPPSDGIAPESPLDGCGTSGCGKAVPRLFDRDGNPATREPAESPGPRLYRANAVWHSAPLDSGLPRCQWNRIELELPALPPGTRAVVSTYTAEDIPYWDVADPSRDYIWKTRFTITGPMQSRPGQSTAVRPDPEFLVQGGPGRYLWIRLQLAADGFGSPIVSSMRVHFPRQSYLDYLPAVYRQDPESASFLERFLSIAQTEWDGLEQRINDIAAYFDPKAVPDGPSLTYLSKWLALPFEGTWTQAQRRALLEAAPRFSQRRGTPASLQSFLHAYVRILSGVGDDSAASIGYPQLVEGFRQRQYLTLGRDPVSSTGAGRPMWSAGIVDRCQLSVFATEGNVRMISTGDPEHDVFQRFAHRFSVFVPAAWIRSADDERQLRRAIDAEKPAHTQYDLCLVEPRFRVGVQSTVGVDTVIGAFPVARLACPHDADAPPGRQPSNRLGYDMVLAAARPEAAVLQIQPGTRVGIDSRLT